MLEGGDARDSYEASVNNAFEMTVGWARGNMSIDPNKALRPKVSQVVEPFTEVRHRTSSPLPFISGISDTRPPP